jgi:large subunit ribosomal protein L9
VSEGYATSFLFPQSLAVEATPEELARRASEEENHAPAAPSREQLAAQKRAEKLEGCEVVLQAPTDEGGVRLVEPLTASDVAKAIKKASGVAVTPKQLTSFSPLQEVGHAQVTVEVGAGFDAQVTVVVEGEAAGATIDA